MPSARATALTQQHRAEIGRVAAVAGRQVGTLARTANPADIDAWWETAAKAALNIVTGGAAAVATMAVRYMRDHAAIEGVRLNPIRAVPPADKLTTSLRVMGPVAFKTHLRSGGNETSALRVMTSQLVGVVGSRVIDGSRDSAMATFTASKQVVGWRRITRANACAFCLMLASRGAVYSKEIGEADEAKAAAEFKAHEPRCHCTAEMLYLHEPEPADVVALRGLWEQSTDGLGGRDAINAFRRAVAARRREDAPLEED